MPFTKSTVTPVKGQKVYVPPSALCTVSSVDLRDGIYWVQIIEQPGAEYNWNFLMERQAKWAKAHAGLESPGREGESV
jgi:hypothetical protein